MTYSDFVDSLSYGFSLFINTLYSWSEILIHNYIFITLLGCVLFCSLVMLVYNYFIGKINDKSNELDSYLEQKRRYWLSQDIAMDYYYLNKFKIYHLKIDKYRLNKCIEYDYLNKYIGDEFRYRFRNLVLNREVGKAFNLIQENNKKKTKHIKEHHKHLYNKLPSWFNKKIKDNPPTEEEKNELQNIINNF